MTQNIDLKTLIKLIINFVNKILRIVMKNANTCSNIAVADRHKYKIGNKLSTDHEPGRSPSMLYRVAPIPKN